MTTPTIQTNTFKERIEYLIDTLAGGNTSRFASELGVSEGNVRSYKNGTLPKVDFLEKIVSCYDIDPTWLITGENKDPDNTSRNQTISPREILPKTDMFDYINNDNDGKIPVIHELSFALQDPDRPIEVAADEYYYIKEFRNADFLLRFSGDYMLPRFKPGDLLACRNVKYSNFYQWGRIYALLTCHQGLVIGRVFEHHQSLMFIRVKPMNPDYPEWEIPLDEVAKVAIVVGSISTD